jgi:hypothetical protein
LNKGADLAKKVESSIRLNFKGWGNMKGFFNKVTGNVPEKIDLRDENYTTVYKKDG